jgi:dihydrofolate synthase/folylpolyglutamate synthase
MFSQLPVFQRLGKAAYKDNLDNTWALMDLLNHPYKKFKSVHIAGTNGKGSTSHLMASAFQEAEIKTGLYTSPHLKDFRERIRVNGQMIGEGDVVEFIEQHQKEFEAIQPSFFEMTVAMAFWHFEQEGVEMAILETGMGGRLDSTNVVIPELSVITNIGLDHQQFLGDTLEKIAMEKAGIIKAGIPVIVGETQESIKSVFIDKARDLNAPIEFADEEYQIEKVDNQFIINGVLLRLHLQVPLGGDYQQRNILTAFAACRYLGLDLERIMVGFNQVLENTGLRGRWEVLQQHPKVICDTAHNEDGLSYVIKQLSKEKYAHLHIVLGVVNDKSLDKVLSFFPAEATYYFCKADIPRGLDTHVLKDEAAKHHLEGLVYSSVAQAFIAAKQAAQAKDLVFVGGSTFTVAEVL